MDGTVNEKAIYFAAALFTTLGADPARSCEPIGLPEWSILARGHTLPAVALLASPDLLLHAARIDGRLSERVDDLLAGIPRASALVDRLAARSIALLHFADCRYPQQLLRRLGCRAPAVLFVAGDPARLSDAGGAVIGSRDIDAQGTAAAACIGALCARSHLTVFSGAARGADTIAMKASLSAGGNAAAIVASDLAAAATCSHWRAALVDHRLALACPWHPDASFTAPHAHYRNRLVHCLGKWTIVAASQLTGGGTRRGALDNLAHRWSSLYAVTGPGCGSGNADLVARGAHPLPAHLLDAASSISEAFQMSVGREMDTGDLFDQ